MDTRHQLTAEEFTSICASYACKPLLQSPESKAHSTFLLELRNNPEAQLNKMIEKAREIIKKYEYTHPIYQDKVTRKCLLDLEHTINHHAHKKFLNLKQKNEVERKRIALVSCIKLFICFKTTSDTCHNNNPDLDREINSFFEYLTVSKEYLDKRIILRFNKRPSEDALNRHEKIKYKKALATFKQALEKYGLNSATNYSNSHPINQLKILEGNGIAITFCSLVLNTAAQRLEDPTNKFHEERLTNLQKFIRKEQPSVIMKYLPAIFKFVGAVVAIVGLALLLAPPSLIATLELAAETLASPAIATAATGGGAVTFLAGGLFPSPKRYNDASDIIRNANNFISKRTN